MQQLDGKKIENSRAIKRNQNRGKIARKNHSILGGTCSQEGMRMLAEYKKDVKQLNPLSDSISSSPITIENRFLCMRNWKKEAVRLWAIGKKLGLTSTEKDNTVVLKLIKMDERDKQEQLKGVEKGNLGEL